MSSYQKIRHQERLLILAKLYHNIWYDQSRFNSIMELVDSWDMNPIKEVTFASGITDGSEFLINNN
jgi:hypothetical protein